MKNLMDKFGLLVAVAVTAAAVGIVSTGALVPDKASINPQGEKFLDKTTTEITKAPTILKEKLDERAEQISGLPEEIPETIPEAVDKVKEVIPELPKVVKEQVSDSKKLEMVSIPKGTSLPGCENTNSCYVPHVTKIKAGGEIIWDNVDNVVHTVTSGNPQDGLSGLFDSGLIQPGDTYSLKLDLKGEYEYFCLVHPWMQGIVSVTTS